MISPPIVTILIGLPGSGKSTLLRERFGDEASVCYLDDFHGGSLDGTGAFTQSRYYATLRRCLQQSRDCVISDVEYCRNERLIAFEEGLRGLSRELSIAIEIRRLYFENNASACRHNVVHRFDLQKNRGYIAELEKIDALSSTYNRPIQGAIPVKSCCTESIDLLTRGTKSMGDVDEFEFFSTAPAEGCFVCAGCIDDIDIKAFIESEADTLTCDFCGRKSRTRPIAAPLEEVVLFILEAVEREYERAVNALGGNQRRVDSKVLTGTAMIC